MKKRKVFILSIIIFVVMILILFTMSSYRIKISEINRIGEPFSVFSNIDYYNDKLYYVNKSGVVEYNTKTKKSRVLLKTDHLNIEVVFTGEDGDESSKIMKEMVSNSEVNSAVSISPDGEYIALLLVLKNDLEVIPKQIYTLNLENNTVIQAKKIY